MCVCSTLPLQVTLLAVTALRAYTWNVLSTGHAQLPNLRQVMGPDGLYSACANQKWDSVCALVYIENAPLSVCKENIPHHTEKRVIPILQRICRKLLSLGQSGHLLLAIPLCTAFTLTTTLITYNWNIWRCRTPSHICRKTSPLWENVSREA